MEDDDDEEEDEELGEEVELEEEVESGTAGAVGVGVGAGCFDFFVILGRGFFSSLSLAADEGCWLGCCLLCVCGWVFVERMGKERKKGNRKERENLIIDFAKRVQGG